MVQLCQKVSNPTVDVVSIPVQKGQYTKARKLAREAACVSDAKAAIAHVCNAAIMGEPLMGRTFQVIAQGESTHAEWLAQIRNTNADVIETDFPFRLAQEGLLLTETFDIVNMKVGMLNNMELLYNPPESAPRIVKNAASHSKSYVHHLFRCDELSGPILLATVNLFQFQKIFE